MRSTAGLLGLVGVVAVIALGCPRPTPLPPPPDAGTFTGGGGGGGGGGGANPDAGVDGGLADGGVEVDAGPKFSVIADLRVDVNRDGVVEVTPNPEDDLAEDSWDSTHGAIFLANIDDDAKKCPLSSTITDVDLAKCHDGADEIVNGPDDVLDLAVIKTVPWPEAEATSTAKILIPAPGDAMVRLFIKRGDQLTVFPNASDLTVEELKAGAELFIEAKDIVRDSDVWDGFINVSLVVIPTPGAAAVTDTVRMRVSPVMTIHHLEPAETVHVANFPQDPDSLLFQNALAAASSAAGLVNPVHKYTTQDQWNQDYFETGYMAMPSVAGKQHVIRVNYRSANIYYNSTKSPLRRAGRVAFALRGKDMAAVQQFDLSSNGYMDSLNSFGNTETIPPYELNGISYPLGRLYRGSVPSFHPDKSFSKMMESQGQQPPVYVDTSWLLVGHVDESVSFLKVNSPRGWILLVNDVPLAKKMLEDEVAKGNGAVKMFVGQYFYDNFGNQVPADVSISAVLANADVMNESAKSALEVDAQLQILKAETGLTDAEIIRVPFLHEPVDGYSLAYQPGTVNMLVLNQHHVFVPDPHGPVINGVDIFKKQLEDALAPHGVTIHWVDDWNLYHTLAGEVHCGTNATRAIPSAKWWESGR